MVSETTSVTNWPAPMKAASTSAAAIEPETVRSTSGTPMAAAAAMSARRGRSDEAARCARPAAEHAADAERRQQVAVAGGAEAETLAEQHEEDGEGAVDGARDEVGADEREGVGVLAQRAPAGGEVGADRGVDSSTAPAGRRMASRGSAATSAAPTRKVAPLTAKVTAAEPRKSSAAPMSRPGDDAQAL